MRVGAVVPLLLGLIGCGGDGDGDGSMNSISGTCGVRAEVSGAATFNYSGGDEAACLTQHSSGAGIELNFVSTAPKGSLEIWIDELLEGQTGSGFQARVAVTAAKVWQSTTCVASVSEHRLLSTEASSLGELRHYQVSGDGSCPEALAPVRDPGEAITIQPFAFRAQVVWRD